MENEVLELSDKELGNLSGGTMTAGDFYSGTAGAAAGVVAGEGIAALGGLMACACPPLLAGLFVVGVIGMVS